MPTSDQVAYGKFSGDPNEVLGVEDIAKMFRTTKKWVYETFTPQCPPSKTGINGGGRSLWFRWQVLAFMEAKRIANQRQPRNAARRRKPRKKVA